MECLLQVIESDLLKTIHSDFKLHLNDFFKMFHDINYRLTGGIVHPGIFLAPLAVWKPGLEDTAGCRMVVVT